MSRTQPTVYRLVMHILELDERPCYICDRGLVNGDPAYATGRGRSIRYYCSERCADPRPCAICPHPQRQHDAHGCFAPVVDRWGNEDACGCRTAREESG